MTAPPPPHLDDVLAKGFDAQVTRKVFALLFPYKFYFLAALFLLLTGSATVVAGPYLIKLALDSALKNASLPELQNIALLYLGLAALNWLCGTTRLRLIAKSAQSIIYDVRSKLFTHLQELSLSFYSRYSAGRLITRVINDVNVLRDFITWAMLAIVNDIFVLLGVLVTMLSMDTSLALMTFAVLPVMVLMTIQFRKRARAFYRKGRVAMSWVNSVLAENINGVRVVQSFSREETNYLHFSDTVNRNNLDINMQSIRLNSFFFPGVDFLGSIAMALVIWIGGTAVLGQTISPGLLVAFVLYINRFFDPIRDLSMRYDSFEATMASGERIFELMATPIEVQDQPDAVELPQIRGEVIFDQVSFHYSDDPTPVLSNINLHIQPGKTIALVGKTGAGKSTLVKLLSRFHDTTDGRILIDNIDLKQVKQQSLRCQMGIVLQEPFLFSDSIRENIRFGRLKATNEEVEWAARMVGADDFIHKLKQGYDSQVGEGGVNLSVGQRQLVSFARALLADPRILILDEATSSIDTQTEQLIQSALAQLLKNRTAFVIAHRLSTIVNADCILVVNDGGIVEQGTHNELIALKGQYYHLYQMNFNEN